ncbi:MAG TPA: DUF4143 domain-containing protein, partial [bacterium]|nr:DUF4143 domain-containing protein [bacterium]
EYLMFGGYPRVILEETTEGKAGIMDEILKSYIEKDIFYLLRLEKTEEFFSLMRLLSDQIGQLVNYAELASTLHLSLQTVKHYLWYLEKTFILERIKPFFRNVRKEITKSPVVYYRDPGLRNYILNQFRIPAPREMGFLFQNLVFLLLKEKLCFTPATLHFWRTTEKAEVDLVVNWGREILPIEVKYRDMNKPSVERSLRSFIRKYSPKKALIVNKNYSHRCLIEETEVHFVPIMQLCFLAASDLS